MLLFPNLLLLFLSISLICAVESAPFTLRSNDTNGQNLTLSQEASRHAGAASDPRPTLGPTDGPLISLKKTLKSLLSNPNTSHAAIETMASALDASRKLSPSSSQRLPSSTPADKSTTQSPFTGSGEKMVPVGESC